MSYLSSAFKLLSTQDPNSFSPLAAGPVKATPAGAGAGGNHKIISNRPTTYFRSQLRVEVEASQ